MGGDLVNYHDTFDWFGWLVIGSFLLFVWLMARDLAKPSTLADKPRRAEFLDEHQVRHILAEAKERELAMWVAELAEDTHAVEADRDAKRAAGLCSCTPDEDLPDNCLIADRRCVIHGAFHD